jgi:hypothetical protein
MDEFQTLGKAITAIASIATWQSVGVITAAGTIAMAILQLIKDLSPLRRWYQQAWLDSWTEKHTSDFNADLEKAGDTGRSLPQASAMQAKSLLVELATGGEMRAFYELPIEQMVAQMNAAVQITLDYPKKYCGLLVVLSDGADIDDVAVVVGQSPEGSKARKGGPSKGYLEARTRVGHRIQRNLDAVQISLGSDWQFWMQVTAVILSTLVLEAGVVLATRTFDGKAMLLAVPVGILSGYLAPIARDLVAALQSLRK